MGNEGFHRIPELGEGVLRAVENNASTITFTVKLQCSICAQFNRLEDFK